MSATIKELHCIPCGHKWYPRVPEPPICCPKCRRADWKTGQGPRSIKAAKSRIQAKLKKRMAKDSAPVDPGY